MSCLPGIKSDLMAKAEMNEVPSIECRETLKKIPKFQSSLIEDIGKGLLCANNRNGSITCKGKEKF